MKGKKIIKSYYILAVIAGVVIVASVLFFLFSQKKAIDDIPLPQIVIQTGATASGTDSYTQGLTEVQLQTLQKTYDNENSPDVAKPLMQQYILKSDFVSAYELLGQTRKNNQEDVFGKDILAYVTYNYYTVTKKDETTARHYIADSSAPYIYDLLDALFKKNYGDYATKLQTFSADNTKASQPLVAALLHSRQTYRSLKSVPDYYYTGLIAATLMEGGYVPLAEQLAKDIIKDDEKYILAYELLSQIAIKEQRYKEAIDYLKKLLDIDTAHLPRTSFFLGMAYYYEKDYTNALLYLNQVRDEEYVYDAVRYMILIHHDIGQTDKMMDEFRFLLTSQKLVSTDYALLFDIVFYEPYVKQSGTGEFELAKKYALSLIVPYIDTCRKELSTSSPYICKYGEAGWYLSQYKADKAFKDLLYLSKTYPHPIIFQALGDYYTQEGDTTKAEQYYLKALLGRSEAQNTGNTLIQ